MLSRSVAPGKPPTETFQRAHASIEKRASHRPGQGFLAIDTCAPHFCLRVRPILEFRYKSLSIGFFAAGENGAYNEFPLELFGQQLVLQAAAGNQSWVQRNFNF